MARIIDGQGSQKEVTDQFNKLCLFPDKQIDLQDGRVLEVLEWSPHLVKDEYGVPINIKGRIVPKEARHE